MTAPLRVMPLGDSITAGVHFIGGVRTCEAGGYRAHLWRAVKDVRTPLVFVGSLCDGPPDVSRDHEGHPGWRTAELLEHVARWLAEARPDIVLLMSGTNDIIRDNDATLATDRLSRLVAMLFEATPGIGLGIATIPPLSYSESRRYLQTAVEEYNEKVRDIAGEVAAKGARIMLADVHGVMKPAHLIGTHPSPDGYRRIAEVWKPVLLALSSPRPSR